MYRYVIGIDEVGRGPIAGPVAVGSFVFLDQKAKNIFKGVRESKQLSEQKREEWFNIIQVSKKNEGVDFQVCFQSEKVIDSKGLSYAIRTALASSLNMIVKRNKIKMKHVQVLLDGGLKAPVDFEQQKTIIKGDEKEMVIALASICAKVLRDRKMHILAKKYPKYGLENNKGYGTKYHYVQIRKFGIQTIHRKSFLTHMK
jgi:ribonuclease HII